jgi:myo-inositol-1(or 4)-monophosphatase
MSAREIEARYQLARAMARELGEEALALFRARETLVIESKGPQDMVSAADRRIEQLVRERVAAAFPDDGFLGEEGGMDRRDARFLWVIDPIDGTTCFVTGMHAWCLSIGVLCEGRAVVGVVHDPSAGEMFHAREGGGAFVNAAPIRVAPVSRLDEGVLGVGFSNRVPVEPFIDFLQRMLQGGGMFIRNGSGALMLAYAAAGRLIGYYEPHMNAWDCVAGMVLVREAGGVTNDILGNEGLVRGNVVVAAAPRLYPVLLAAIAGVPSEAPASEPVFISP